MGPRTTDRSRLTSTLVTTRGTVRWLWRRLRCQGSVTVLLGVCLAGFGGALVHPFSARAEEPSPVSSRSSMDSWEWWNPLTWHPTDEEIQKYRRSWNPMSHGPILNTGIDISPKGQFLLQPFLFGEVAHEMYTNKFGTDSVNSPVHLRGALAPTAIFVYGITDHDELNIAPSWLYFNAEKTDPNTGKQTFIQGDGPGDTTIYVKHRFTVQDPDSWRPTFTVYNGVTLPTSQWFNTTGIPGGFSPLGRLPGTKLGGLSFTEGLMWRKNIKPFRFNAAVYYSYTAPGTAGPQTGYNGDIINSRFIMEYVANEKKGLVFATEFLTLHGLDWRLDGHKINLFQPNGNATFNLIGVQPTVEYKLWHDPEGGGAWVVAAGCLFSIAGQNDFNAIYPNFSMYYFFPRKGGVFMR